MSTQPVVPQLTIPAFTGSGVLPPFLGVDPTIPATVSPYKTTLMEIVDRFSFSPERRAILSGFIAYRAALMAAGLTGFQWLDGSFLEDVETTQSRNPNDIDCITFVRRPLGCLDPAAWQTFTSNNQALLTPHLNKQQYSTDAYLVDLEIPPESVVQQTAYWFGLFSHRRVTGLWKGMLEVVLQNTADDAAALALLATK